MAETYEEGAATRRREKYEHRRRLTEEELRIQQEMSMVVDRKPKSIYVRYTGAEPLYHDGRAPKLEGGILFTPGGVVEVRGVPRDELGRVLTFADEDMAVGWDTADIEFFRQKAEKNPGTWQVVDGPDAPPRPAPAEPKKKSKKSGGD